MRLQGKKRYLFLAIIAIFCASLPLFDVGIHTGHDFGFHLQRIISMKNAIQEGTFPIRIFKEAFGGYGYGAPLFYPYIFLYIPAFLYYLGISLALSYKIFLIIMNIFTLAIAAYSFSYITRSKDIGFISAVLYELSVYRFSDIYTRASIGECLALVFCPLVLCGMVLIKRGDIKKWWILALGMTGVLQSHILSFILIVVICGIYGIVYLKDFLMSTKIIAIIKAAILTIAVNVWFLIPFLDAMKMPTYEGTSALWMTDATLGQIFDLSIDNTVGAESLTKNYSECIIKSPGMPIIIGCILFLFVLPNIRKKFVKECRECYFYLIGGAVALCMTTNIFPWKLVRKIHFLEKFFEKFQFLWRFNTLVLLLWCVIAASGYYFFFKKQTLQKNLVVTIVLVNCLYSLVFCNHYMRQSETLQYDTLESAGYMDTLYFIKDNDIASREELESNADNIEYSNYERENAKVSFYYEIKGDMQKNYYVDVPIAYYPGYEARIDGQIVKNECSTGGVVRVWLTQNEGTVSVEYVEKRVYKIADFVSIISVISFSIWKIGGIISKKRIEETDA